VKKGQIVGLVLGIVIGAVIALSDPPQGLSVQGIQCLGIFAGAIIFLIFGVMPDFVVTTLMGCLWAIFSVVPLSKYMGF